MYSPEGRTARTPGSVKLTAAAVSIALMGMAGVALAAPKADPGPPPQAQGNGPPPHAQDNGPPPQAQNPPAPPAGAKANAKGPGKPAETPPAQPPQAGGGSGSGSGAGPSLRSGAGHHGRPAPGEIRGQGHIRSNAAESNGCQAARCQGGTPEPSTGEGVEGVEPPKPSRGKRGADKGGVSEERPNPDHGGAGADLGSVQGLNQGGGEEASAARGSFDGALPFTGFELALLAAIGALLALAGVWLRRSIA
jgi:hypothetical protein